MKNLSQMRLMVFDEIEKLQNGKTDVKKLNAIVSALNLILSTAKLELEYAKALNKSPKMDFVQISFEDDDQPRRIGK